MPPGTGNSPPGSRRIILLSLTFTTLLTAFFLIVAAMTAAYILGVMTGRSQEAAPPVQIAAQSGMPAASHEPTENTPHILKAHELEFTHVLRGEPAKNRESAAVPPKEEAPPKAEALPRPAVQEPAPQADAGQPPQAGEEPEKLSDYIFQIAALKDEQAVDNLREKLEGRGLRTRMERSGKLLIVMVLIRGDSARVNELNAICSELRLGAPLLRAKKPVAP